MQSRVLVELQFTQRYKRGAILRFEMPCDDPNRDLRNKFGIVLNLDTAEPDTLLAITTTNPRLLASRFMQRDSLVIAANKYHCFDQLTYISLREVKSFPLAWMKQQSVDGKMAFHGDLDEWDMAELNSKLASSLIIEGVLLKRVVVIP